MGITTLWPLALLLMVPVIILLYILKQQAKPQSFSSVMLWQEVFRNIEATKPWEKLRKNLLLFLQLLAALLFVTAMVGPWISQAGTGEKHVILVLDNSASMDTIYEDDVTRLEAAKEAACDYVDGLNEKDVVYVIAGNQQAALVLSNSTDHSEIKKRIRSIEQTTLSGDMSQTLGLVQSCASQAEGSRIVFFTDTAFDAGGLTVSVESFYSEPANLAIGSMNYAMKNGTAQVLVLVQNYSDSEVTEDVNLYGISEQQEDTLLAIKSITVPAKDSASVYFELPEAELSRLIALRGLLNEKDGLKGDNEAWCPLDTTENRRILLLTKSNLFLEKAFANIAGTEVYRTSDLSVLDSGDTYDLYIFDGMVPEKLPKNGSFLFINTSPKEGENGNAWFAAAKKAEGSVYTLLDTEVTDYVSGTKIGVNASYIYEVPSWGRVFLSGNQGTAGFYGTYDGHRMAALGFDLHQTDFALTAEFPIFAADLAEYLTAGSLTDDDTYICGESTILYGSSAGSEVIVTAPDGTQEKLSAEEAYGCYKQLNRLGVYQIEQKVGEEERSQTIAVLFPTALESKVESAETMLVGGTAQNVEKHTGALELRRYILILLIILLIAEFIIYIRQLPKRKKDTRRIGELVLRSLLLLLTVLSLFGISIRRNSKLTTTVFLVDLSDSIGGLTRQEEAFVRESIAKMPAENQAGIIVFGSETKVEQFVTEKKSFTQIQSSVTSSATNLEQALQSALSMFPDTSAKRIVLLTDGEENEGSLANTISQAAASGAELKVVKYDNTIEEEVYVSNVSLPNTITQGDRFQVNVEIYSTLSTEATVSLYSGRTLKDQKTVILQKGTNQLVFSDRGVEQGIRSYRVVVDAAQDTVSVNNTYSAFTTVEAQPTLLLVEGNDGETEALMKVLDAANLKYEKVSPSGVPNTVNDLLRYDTVILQNVYAADLRNGFLDTLETYVGDYAGGLVCIGGTDSYALGNYQNTTLEDILPVSSELTGEKQIPSIAMVMVIDHSGSMESSSTGRGATTCLDVAKNAAVNALSSLRDIDRVGVLAFDDAYDWTVPIQPVTDYEKLASAIASIPGGGGTSIYPAVAEAMHELEKSDAAIRHIVLLTDGQDGYNKYEPLYTEMEENGITLSTVAIGSDADSGTLMKMAENGNGRYYYSDAGSELPRIFAQEVFLSTKSYLINEEFVPTLTNTHEVTTGVFDQGSPSLLGYVATSIKPTAIQILASHREDPVLAVWQYGLGHTVAWTSDASGEWTGNFSGWDNYVTLWRNLIDWSMSDTSLGDDTLNVEQQAGSAVITYETDNYTSDTKVQAVVTDEEGNQKTVTLTPAAPGKYRATVDLGDTGVYSISLRNRNGDTLIKSINTAAAMQYSREYRFADVTNNLNTFTKQLNGRFITTPAEVFDTKLEGSMKRTDLTLWLLLAAALLFLLDIICRRMSIDWLRSLRTMIRKAAGAPAEAIANAKANAKENEEAKAQEKAKEQVRAKEQEQPKEQAQAKTAGKAAQTKPKEQKKQPQAIDTAALLNRKKDLR